MATSYGKPVSKTKKAGLNTLAGVFAEGSERIGPASLEVPPIISGEASNAACHFFRISF